MLKDLLLRNRSYRRFHADKAISEEQLTELVELTRYCGCVANLQPLRYLLSVDKERNDRIFNYLGWAGYLKDWKGPAENERPSGYIVIIGDKTISDRFDGDSGIAAQSILLGAVEKGLGGCMIGSIQKQKFREEFKIPTRFEIVMVIALGYPAEEVRLVDKEESGDIKYWRDESGVHYVPKRTMDHLVLSWIN
ncbi:nitroreductase family protein [Desulfuromonas acetoxidans]|uniref:Nitroreductase n=1 Tax=Desulfuromonas acetoxidans (strain DSM 684 / 11070) TaxID=281689 RepID=Q1JXS8_DESA6|nr:nitroreductase family protein [Desulfuromonas acetoxidans]EAT15065.1 nitroreductase [Desulfuromonas acetoxidans DSM 684]MBF0646460.1 nitroreductase family protein [Desulfuromonas acetoxidans]NVD24991.1 nitroreductase family protein [Desulfuromonas acetoxidans]NVE15292.1 nitroreductase family protein [Desulfuromonas acetoxidans]